MSDIVYFNRIHAASNSDNGVANSISPSKSDVFHRGVCKPWRRDPHFIRKFNPSSLDKSSRQPAQGVLNYDVQSASITGQTINAVMKFPAGFAAKSSGKAELKSTLTDKSIQDLIANVTFTASAKTDTISNEISIPIKLVGSMLVKVYGNRTPCAIIDPVAHNTRLVSQYTFRSELVNMARIMV